MTAKNRQYPYELLEQGSHTIPESTYGKKEINLPASGFNRVNKKKLSVSNPFELSKTYKVGEGANGIVYKVSNTESINTKILESYEYATGRIFSSKPYIESDIVIKVVNQDRNQYDDDEFIQSNVHENLVHKNLSESSLCSLVPNANPVCIADYIPKFYLSFITKKTKNYQSVTVMNNAGDQTLKNSLENISQKKLLTLYVQVERATCSMWLAGYIHGDLHTKNIMTTKDDTDPKIIDFGFGVVLPANFKIKIAQFISKIISEGSNRSLGEVWTEISINGTQTLIEYINTIQLSRRFPGYNPDSNVLKRMWNKILPSNRKKIPMLRAQLWGLKTNIQPNSNNIIEEPSPSRRVNSNGRPFKTVFPTSAQLRKTNNSNNNSSQSRRVNSNERPFATVWPTRAQLHKMNNSYPKMPNSYSKMPNSYSKMPNSYPKMPNSYPKMQNSLQKSRYSPQYRPNTPRNEIPVNSPDRHIGKVNKKGRDIFKNDKNRTYVMQNGKKVYVKKMFLPSDLASERMIGTDKVNAKKRKVYENSSGSKYVKSGDKRIRVSRVFNRNEQPKRKLKRKPTDPASPRVNIEKVNAKGRKVYRNSDGRTYVLQDGKKVFVKKLLTPKLN